MFKEKRFEFFYEALKKLFTKTMKALLADRATRIMPSMSISIDAFARIGGMRRK